MNFTKFIKTFKKICIKLHKTGKNFDDLGLYPYVIGRWDRAQGGLIANNEWAYIGFLFGLFVTWPGRDRPLCGLISVVGLYPGGLITRVDCNYWGLNALTR